MHRGRLGLQRFANNADSLTELLTDRSIHHQQLPSIQSRWPIVAEARPQAACLADERVPFLTA